MTSQWPLIMTSQWPLIMTSLWDTHCEITIGDDVAWDFHCDITMHNDIAMNLFYCVFSALCLIVFFIMGSME